MAEDSANAPDDPEALQAKISELETRVLKQRREIRRLRKRLHQHQLEADGATPMHVAAHEEPAEMTAEDLRHLHALIKGRAAA